MKEKSDLQDAIQVLQDNNSFLIAGHINPDGDCLGCACALGLFLENAGKSVIIVSPEGVPDLYRFLPGSEKVRTEVPAGVRFDAAVIVDCEGLDRLGPVLDSLKQCDTILEIDHHPGGERGSNVQIIDPSAAACGEIVCRILDEAEARIDPKIAECLLTAIVTDTGSFRFSNVTPSTLKAAASLLEAGATPSRVAHKVYETRSLAGTKLLGLALSTLQTTTNGRIAYAIITRSHMESSHAVEAETEGIVNYVRSVRGAQVGILFREGTNGSVRISLRSRDGYDISQVARLFGGGGHRTAAGCTVERPLNEAIDMVIGAVRKWMGS